MAWLKSLLRSYFGFNYIYACIIVVLCWGGIYWIVKINNRKHERINSKRDILWALVVGLYLGFIFCGTLLNRKMTEAFQMKLMPFWSYRQFILKGNMHLLGQMIYNVLAFIPWPFLFVQVFRNIRNFRWAVGSAFLFSVFIEMTQLIFKLGLFEFDDMFHNVLGSVIGYWIYVCLNKHIKKGVKE